MATATSTINDPLPVCCLRVGGVHISGGVGGEEVTMTVEVMEQSRCTVVTGQVTVCREQLSDGVGVGEDVFVAVFIQRHASRTHNGTIKM